MTKTEIIERLAKERRVETFVENLASRHIDADLSDLCQIVYLALLEYDEVKIIDLWENGELDYFIARIICNQYNSTKSPYYMQIRKFRRMVDEELEINDTSNVCRARLDILDCYKVLDNEE